MRKFVWAMAAGLSVIAAGAVAEAPLVTPLILKPVVLETPAAPAMPVVNPPESPTRAVAPAKKNLGKRAKAGPKPPKVARKSPVRPVRKVARR